ncbi:DNA polymerase III subunit delta [Brachybacterium huguangmaarense]|uniref:DNA polymerase III subunit delta n=1 Tax=Brachybacterium huguangmaarense TaxID=1652028 RepID=A0ABY6FYZ1_9MICO|nr:DNA polymerase III subunit delta [Brachybacterium huguangmaarense]UYG16158.1 DNA polymerase III subunit delta [Brachybacterium huguangmaarense]
MVDVAWHSVDLAPLVLLHGSEPLLAQRALERLREQARHRDPETAFHEIRSEAATAGSLAQVASPSLFGESRFVVVPDLQSAPETLVAEIDAYRSAPEPDVTLVLIHRGGNRGKRLLDALRRSDVPRVPCDPIKRPADKQTFVTAEFTRHDRRIQPDAAAALVDAFGGDLSELAAIARQLLEDTVPDDPSAAPPPVTLAAVRTLTAGRVESTAFAVADAAIAGREGDALVLLQQASLAGVDPVPLVAAVASKMRSLAKVTVPGASARTLGMPDWMLRNLSREARAWNDRSLARALDAVARADHEVKGAGRDPQWSVQRMVTEICRARRAR